MKKFIYDDEGNEIGFVEVPDHYEEHLATDSAAAHITTLPPKTPEELAKAAIIEAMEFGSEMMLNFSKENVLLGISQAGKTKPVLDFLLEVKTAMDTGSLYAAIAEIDSLISAGLPAELEPFITEDRLTTFKRNIQAYLKIESETSNE